MAAKKKLPKKKFPALKPSPIVETLCAPLVGITGDMKSLITALEGVAVNLLAADLTVLELAVAQDHVAKILKDQKLTHTPTKIVRAAFRMVTPKKVEGQDAIPPDPEPWPTPVDGAKLLTAMRDRFTRYILLPPMAAEHCALDCLRTHVYDCFEHNPYHIITSPTLGYGKTELLKVKRPLVRRAPLKLISNITGPSLTRMIDKDCPSVLLDEGDALDVTQKFRAILNSAHTKAGASVPILVPRLDGGWENRYFSTWSPLTIALIGKLNPTVMSRAIVTRMKKKLPMEFLAPFGEQEGLELHDLRRQCIRWAQDHVAELRHAPSPAMPAELTDDRAQDCWRGMLTIADLCGGPWPTLAREAAVVLSGAERDDASLGVTLLRDLRAMFKGREQLPSRYMLDTLNQDEDGPWSGMGKRGITGNDVARLLDGFIAKRDNRVALNFPKDDWDTTNWGPYPPGGKAKGFKRALFEDAWVRNLEPVLPVLLKDLYVQGVPLSCENEQITQTHQGVIFTPDGSTSSTGQENVAPVNLSQEPAP